MRIHQWIAILLLLTLVSHKAVAITVGDDDCICDPDHISVDSFWKEIDSFYWQMDAAKHVYNTIAPTVPSPLNPTGSVFSTNDVYVKSNPLTQFPEHRMDDPFILYTDKSPRYPNYMPEVGNGHIATVLNNEAIFMNGLYNGANITSHRARIPSTVSFICYGFTPDFKASYTLNLARGYYTESHTNGEMTVSLTTLVHRTITGVIVNLLTVSRTDASKEEDVFIHLVEGPPSEDIDFFKDDDGLLMGRTRVAEYPELMPRTTFYMKTSASLEGRHIVKAGERRKTFAAFTVIDVSREKVLRDYKEAVRAYHDDTLLPLHFKEWDRIWQKGRIEVEGNLTLSRINNAAMYYLYSSLPFNDERGDWPFIGLSPGGLAHGDKDRDYMGHVFWDQDLWMSPGLSLLHDDVAKLLVKTRTRTLKAARMLAQRTGYEGARYPWESALTGLEVCPGSPYSDLEIHVTGDVMLLMRQYWYLTKDRELFLNGDGYQVVAGAAEFFASRATYEPHNDTYRILGVMPPDEYHYPVDDSVFTNYIARLTLRFANELSHSLGKPENKTWTTIAEKLVILYDELMDYNPEYSGFQINEVTKQADVILLSYPLMAPLDHSTKRNNLDIYEKTTPIGPAPAMTWSVYLIDWLELGDEPKAADLFTRSILNAQKPFYIWTENSDGKGATNFLTGMGGHLQALMFGYGGCRLHHDHIRFSPKMIPSTTSTTFHGIDYMGYTFDLHFTHLYMRLTITAIADSAQGLEIQFSDETVWQRINLSSGIALDRQPFKIRPINQ